MNSEWLYKATIAIEEIFPGTKFVTEIVEVKETDIKLPVKYAYVVTHEALLKKYNMYDRYVEAGTLIPLLNDPAPEPAMIMDADATKCFNALAEILADVFIMSKIIKKPKEPVKTLGEQIEEKQQERPTLPSPVRLDLPDGVGTGQTYNN